MLTPGTEAELAEMIRAAEGPQAIQGGGTRGVAVAGAALTTAGLTGITTYEPGALTLVAKAGTPVAEIEAALQAENQMLAFEPMDHRALLGSSGEPTIGGVVAANVSGPRRVQAGACRDFLLGVRFVDGRGDVLKNGGRVMKNVTGYDLARLQCGAHGTLGVLTEVSLKVLPRPETEATLVLEGAGHTASLDAMTRAMRSPYEVSGAGRLPAGAILRGGGAVLRLEGFAGSVAYRAEALRALIPGARVEADPEASRAIWKAVRDVAPLAGRAGELWVLSLKPSDMPGVAGQFGPEDTVIDWAGGRVWLCAPEGTDVHGTVAKLGGHATRVRGAVRRFQPEDAPLAAMAAGLRAKFDPRGILNRGLMG